jgi:hypothetical protein
MPPDAFRTKLNDPITAFYKEILKKTVAGGRSMAKPLFSKFVTKSAPVPVPGAAPSGDAYAYADAVEPPSAAVEPPFR